MLEEQVQGFGGSREDRFRREQAARGLEAARRELETVEAQEAEVLRAFAEQEEGLRFNEDTGELETFEDVSFEDTLLGRIEAGAEVGLDPRLEDLTDRLINRLGIQEQATGDALTQNLVDSGLITQQELQTLQDVQNQTGGTIDEAAEQVFGPGGIQSRLQGLEQQVPGALQSAIGLTENIAVGDQLKRAFLDQAQGFQDDISNAIEGAGALQGNVLADAEDLISAFNEQSKFEEQEAIQQLNDQLAARGLADSGAAIEGIAEIQDRFARSRNIQSAQVRQSARQQQFQQGIQAAQTVGGLAAQGTNALQAAGQLGLSQRAQQLGAAGQLANLNLQGIGSQAGLIGQLQNATQQGLGLNLQAGQFQAGLAGQIGQSGRNQANLALERSLQLAGLPVSSLQAQQGAILNQQNIRNQIQQQNFQNLQATQAAQFQPLALALGQAGAGSSQAAQASANFAGQAGQSAQAQAAGAGAAIGQGLRGIANFIDRPRGTTSPGFNSDFSQFGGQGPESLNVTR